MRAALALGITLCALPVRAERGLLEQGQLAVQAGTRLRVELESAHGLTPPPGIQNERALRGFSARLCADARCVPLEALDVRPRDGWSLVYRAEFAVPAEVMPGHYALDVRYPGGLAGLTGGVTVQPARPAAAFAPAPAESCSVAAPSLAGAPLGLLLVALSRKLGAARRARDRRGE
ncbi:MAG: hypothetical protein ABW352_21100 [Polyangiales bacterium]